MKLFKTTPTCKASSSESSITVYVIAESYGDAEKKVMEDMKNKKWRYHDYCKSVELIASESCFCEQPELLIL